MKTRGSNHGLGWVTGLWLLVGALAGGAEVSWETGAGFRSRALEPATGRGAGFVALEATQTGVTFTNVLEGDMFLTNFVAHNGAGLAIGDADQDGWPDLYFCNLQGPNRYYRNRGAWRFEEVELGEAACADQASTGATFADVDGDGDLDLLVNGIAVGTRLFLNDGKARWTERKDSGLSRTASATSLALADIDGDGDLDLYCPHFIDAMLLADPTSRFAIARKGDQWEVTKYNGESTRSPKWKGRFEALPGGRVRELPEVHGLYRNEGNGRFKAIEFEPGTYLDEDGKPLAPYRDWGLAAQFRDLNGDGHPDLYVCNDNTSPDRIWINTGRGTFRAVAAAAFRHTSRSSMGVDVGDLDRDGRDDLVVVDMLAREHARRMTQQVRDRPSLNETEDAVFRPQFNRNTVFFGQADGTYVEAALWAGIAATDWTWCPILIDVDLDGYEDLLVTNGFQFDVMDQDSDDRIRDPRQRLTEAQLKRSMQFRPSFGTRNVAFRNRGDGSFEAVSEAWRFDHRGVSYGMAVGDLDQDGDLDVVVNNLNEAATLYRNEGVAPRVAVRLKGLGGNPEGVGARIALAGGKFTQAQEMICGGRYLSGDQAIRVFGLGSGSGDTLRLEVRWRNGVRSVVEGVQPNRLYEVGQPASAPATVPPPVSVAEGLFKDVSERLGHTHVETPFDDWSRQAMVPRRLSRLGPGVVWGDGDGDGWEDLYVAAGKGGRLAVCFNQEGRGFRKVESGALAEVDQGSMLLWHDGLGNRRLLVAQSNLEGPPDAVSSVAIHDPITLRWLGSLPFGVACPGPLASADIDLDGDLDVFVGGRFRPGRYPEAVASAVWINDRGRLVPSPAWSEALSGAGMVNGATFADWDGDGVSDLALAVEWGPVRLFRNRRDRFEEVTEAWGLAGWRGLWTGVVAGDFDADGRMDLACGNWGRNSLYELHRPHGLRLYYGDWNQEGVVRMIEAWGSGNEWRPVRDRAWLSRGFPELPIRFPTHQAFAQATVADLLGAAYAGARFHEVSALETMVFLNRGSRFEAVALPREAQWSPAFAIHVGDWNGDGREDVFLSQNFFGSFADLSREDGGRGLVLMGDGLGGFKALSAEASGIRVLGEQRGAASADFNHDGRVDLVVSQNGAMTKLYDNRGSKPGLRVVLSGPPGNPEAVGAQVRVVYAGGRMGPSRAIQAGSGYGGQEGAALVMGLLETPEAVWIRWPGGREQRVRLTDLNATLRVPFDK